MKFLYSLFFLPVVLFPDCCCEDHFTAGADWLYWRVKEDHLRAGTFADDFPSPIKKYVNAQSIFPRFHFTSGFRVYLDYESCCNQWELKTLFTHMPLHAVSSLFKASPQPESTGHTQFIIPNQSDFPAFQTFAVNGIQAFTTLQTKWGGDFSNLDIDLSCPLNFDSFCFQPNFGFRAAWLSQHLFMGGHFLLESTNHSHLGTIAFKTKMQGYGIEAGFRGTWSMPWGFSLYGHMRGSILYSITKVDLVTNAYEVDGGPTVFVINVPNKDIGAIPMLDYFFGLRFQPNFSRFVTEMHIGYEQWFIFDANMMSAIGGSLSMQGITLGGRLGF